jgi:Na+/H+ antiporter NhaD/arsenite permease-like protein
MDLTGTFAGLIGLFLFVVAYILIALEDKIHLKKSYPALFAGTTIFVVIGIYHLMNGGIPPSFHHSVEHLILEIANIFFFLFVAMTFIEVMVERDVFTALRSHLVGRGYGYVQLFWVTGLLAFFISPIADNLTTALILSTVLLTIEQSNKKFLVLGAINVVVAANAGGAWSPFGDITTLMAWSNQKGTFLDFLALFPASFLGWLVTAWLLSFSLPKGFPGTGEFIPKVQMKHGGLVVIVLGVFTIALSVVLHQLFHLPAIWGMMIGLSLLGFYGHTLKKRKNVHLDVFEGMAKIENDTLLFFFGILAAVGGLGYLGYMGMIATAYVDFDPTIVNVCVGLISAVVDNVPVMYAILTANPALGHDQWMLVTLTAGIGGSLISFGSAAGVGVMGKMQGVYTFSSHLKYAWAVGIGYMVSIAIWYIQFEILKIY